MAKKGLFVLVLAVLVAGGGVFAQFSINGTSELNGNMSIGIGIGLEKLDILAGIGFYIRSDTTSYFNDDGNDNTTEEGSITIYTGIAPKASLSERWSLSFPLLAQVNFRSSKLTYEDSAAQIAGGIPERPDYTLAFRAGGRAEYAFSEHWSIYFGFLWNVISFYQVKWNFFESGTTNVELRYTQEQLRVLQSGTFHLGISFKF